MPGTVGDILEVRNLQQVAVLCVDGTYNLVDEFGIVVGSHCINLKVRPCGVNVETVVFTSAVNGSEVLVNHILTLLAIALDDELLHLLNGQVDGDNLGDAEERALEDGVGAVAQTDFLSDLGGVDIVNRDVVVGEIFLHLCREVLGKLLTFPDGVEKESTVVTQTAGHIIHVEVGLDMASDEVGGVDQIGRTDGSVAETEV